MQKMNGKDIKASTYSKILWNLDRFLLDESTIALFILNVDPEIYSSNQRVKFYFGHIC